MVRSSETRIIRGHEDWRHVTSRHRDEERIVYVGMVHQLSYSNYSYCIVIVILHQRRRRQSSTSPAPPPPPPPPTGGPRCGPVLITVHSTSCLSQVERERERESTTDYSQEEQYNVNQHCQPSPLSSKYDSPQEKVSRILMIMVMVDNADNDDDDDEGARPQQQQQQQQESGRTNNRILLHHPHQHQYNRPPPRQS